MSSEHRPELSPYGCAQCITQHEYRADALQALPPQSKIVCKLCPKAKKLQERLAMNRIFMTSSSSRISNNINYLQVQPQLGFSISPRVETMLKLDTVHQDPIGHIVCIATARADLVQIAYPSGTHDQTHN